jgi:hemoglobin
MDLIMGALNKMYGFGDISYKKAGKLEGITKLVNDFYDFMDITPEAEHIRSMHKDDLTESRKKLSYFLSGWMGGPRISADTFGPLSIPMSHKHLTIDRNSVETWILCMQKAIDKQPYDDTFKVYLIKQLRFPAEKIYQVCNTKV